MMEKMSKKSVEAFVQYSKKMCTRVSVFWMIYRLANFIVVLLRPEVSSALVELCAGVDTIMIVNMSAYTFNSSTEKISVAYAKRKNLFDAMSKQKSSKDDEKDEEDEEEETDSNG